MKPLQVVITAALGAVLGVIASGLWWSVRDSRYACEGGCSPSEKDLPPGDTTLIVGALGGVLVAVGVLFLLSRLLRRRTEG